MPDSTTIRVTRITRDELRALADTDGVTLETVLSRLVRAERQRRMGRALAESDLDEDGRRWIDTGLDTAGRDESG